MKDKVSDWRKENIKIGDKLYMTTCGYWGEPEGTVVYVSEIKKTVLKVKKHLDDKYDYSFKLGKTYSSGLGMHRKLYSSEEEYNLMVEKRQKRKELINNVEKILDNIPNEILEELIAKYK